MLPWPRIRNPNMIHSNCLFNSENTPETHSPEPEHDEQHKRKHKHIHTYIFQLAKQTKKVNKLPASFNFRFTNGW